MMLLEQGGESISLYKQCNGCWSKEEGKLYISNRFLVCCSPGGGRKDGSIKTTPRGGYPPMECIKASRKPISPAAAHGYVALSR